MNGTPFGQRFSHLYLSGDSLSSDSQRMRRRLGTCFREYFPAKSDQDVTCGKILEAELGISIIRDGYARYVPWEDVFLKAELRDVLDSLTIAFRILSMRQLSDDHKKFYLRVTRILAEESVGYSIDEKGGVHPSVDHAFDSTRLSTIRVLDSKRHASAIKCLQEVENAFLNTPISGRYAIRSVFDAVENIIKLRFSSVTHINKSVLNGDVRKFIEVKFAEDANELRTSLKQIELIKAWVDCAHFYRHEAGQPEPREPSEAMTYAMVSQGYAIVRWLVQTIEDVETP